MIRKIKIFVSSPSDVAYERTLARDVFNRLDLKFSGRLEIVPYFWEDGTLLQLHSNPQSQTPLTSEYNILICILWTRLGSLLHPDHFKKPDGSPFQSGTEFEVYTALDAHEKTREPLIYIFRREEIKNIAHNDPATQDSFEQARKLDEFFEEILGKEYLHGSGNTYSKPWEFETKLGRGLDEHFQKLAGEKQHGSGARQGPSANPFRSLRVFEYGDAKLFHGRRTAIHEVIEKMQGRADRGCAFVMIFGGSGLGKSSLGRAGVLPWLGEPNITPNVRLWRHAILSPSQAGTEGGDLFQLLAGALMRSGVRSAPSHRFLPESETDQGGSRHEPEALPEITQVHTADGRMVDLSTLATQLLEAPTTAIGFVEQALKKAVDSLQEPAGPGRPHIARLALFIDQFEELFAHPQREQFLETLGVFAKSGWVWVLASMRSDFYAESANWTRLYHLIGSDGSYQLAPPGLEELTEMIRTPAEIVGLDFEKAKSGRRLDDLLIGAAYNNPYALPLLEFTLDKLFARADFEHGLMRLQVYDELGGLEGALAQHATDSLNKVFPPLVGAPLSEYASRSFEEIYGRAAKRCFGGVMHQLVSIGIVEREASVPRNSKVAGPALSTSGSELPVRRLASKKLLDENPEHAALVNQLVADRLLVVEADETKNIIVTVAHEALLNCWPALATWIREHYRELKIRDRLSHDALAWRDEGKPHDLLYTDASRRDDATDALASNFLDSTLEVEFVNASIAAARELDFAHKLNSNTDVMALDLAANVHLEGRERVLRQAVQDSTSKQARYRAALVLAEHPVPSLLAELVRLVIDDPEDRVRRVAAESLVKLRQGALFDQLFASPLNFKTIGGIARVQIAAEASDPPVDLAPRISKLSLIAWSRVQFRVRGVRFLRAIPTFLLILLPQFFLSALTAGFIKGVNGRFSYAICQGDRSGSMGVFHGIAAAVFWGCFITFGIALHRLVFATSRDRVTPADPVPLRGYLLPVGSLLSAAVFGFLGSFLIISLIASVFSSDSLYSMGWITARHDKSLETYTALVVRDLRYITGYQFPYLFTGTCLGLGLAMMCNALYASSIWKKFRMAQRPLENWRQALRLFWDTTVLCSRFAWPIPVALLVGWTLGFGTLYHFYPQKHTPIQSWRQAAGLPVPDAIGESPDEKKQPLANTDDAIVDSDESKQKLRAWKISPWGQGIGLAGDALAQCLGGFFCIVGYGLGIIIVSKGFTVEPSDDL